MLWVFCIFMCSVGLLLIETQCCHKLYVLSIANAQAEKRCGRHRTCTGKYGTKNLTEINNPERGMGRERRVTADETRDKLILYPLSLYRWTFSPPPFSSCLPFFSEIYWNVLISFLQPTASECHQAPFWGASYSGRMLLLRLTGI